MPSSSSIASILVVHPDRKTQRVVQRILGATGYQIDIAEDVEQAVRLVGHTAAALIVVDGATVHAPGAQALIAAATARGTAACLTLLPGPAPGDVPRLLEIGAVTNLLVHPMPILAEELTITAQKLLRRDLFGLEKYLLWGVQIHTAALVRSSGRAELIDQVSRSVRAAGQSPRVASAAMLIADELLSNAVHNAPVDAAGGHPRRDLPRDADFALAGRDEVRLRWACDARYLAIEVHDRWGSLTRDALARALARSDVRDSGGGAGMGLALTYRSCDHLVVNLAPGEATEIIALIDVRYPPHERPAASSYNLFERGDAGASGSTAAAAAGPPGARRDADA
jgi:DNA-binding response OmpR family regulator